MGGRGDGAARRASARVLGATRAVCPRAARRPRHDARHCAHDARAAGAQAAER